MHMMMMKFTQCQRGFKGIGAYWRSCPATACNCVKSASIRHFPITKSISFKEDEGAGKPLPAHISTS
jgi:hypothetical protein